MPGPLWGTGGSTSTKGGGPNAVGCCVRPESGPLRGPEAPAPPSRRGGPGGGGEDCCRRLAASASSFLSAASIASVKVCVSVKE